MLGLHHMWGYTPEQALDAPVWVLRMTEALMFDQSLNEQAS